VILQTSLTPQFFPPDGETNFGWTYGVEWVYLTAMLRYESVYAIVLPVTLTELLFPQSRAVPWLGQRGLKVSATILVLCSAGVWYLRGHFGLQKYGPSRYQVPGAYVGLALIAIVVLVGVLVVLSASPLDQIGKLVFDLIAILLFAELARRLGRQAPEASRYSGRRLDPEV